MSIKHRIKKLEDSQAVDKSGKIFAFIHLKNDEDENSGLKRYLEESGITKDQIGHAELVGPKGLFEMDFGGYRDITKLQGYAEYLDTMSKIIANIKPSLGPPRYR